MKIKSLSQFRAFEAFQNLKMDITAALELIDGLRYFKSTFGFIPPFLVTILNFGPSPGQLVIFKKKIVFEI